jgi:glycosyltransferase involved in cell wall biosynthesis
LRILFVHNEYARPSGEEHASQAIADLMASHGHQVSWYRRSSAEIADSAMGKVKAFFAGVHNPWTAEEMARRLDELQPDLVQVQNLYPLLSPSIFRPCRERGVPVVMRCPNYRLFCPNGLHLCRGEVCEHCLGSGRELWCVFRNCEGSLAKSVGYALRNWAARVTRRILNGVDMFIVQSEFQKSKFAANGIPTEKIAIVPGITPDVEFQANDDPGELVSFVGRVSPEKGIEEFLQAARAMPDTPFALAGSYEGMPAIRDHSPENVRWMGFLTGEDLNDFYRRSRILVFPSRWYEGFPNVATRAMILGKPVVAAKIGALAEIVDDGDTGTLFAVGDGGSLAEAVRGLYGDAALCRRYGEAGRRKALANYTRDAIYERLMAAYAVAASARSAALGARD